MGLSGARGAVARVSGGHSGLYGDEQRRRRRGLQRERTRVARRPARLNAMRGVPGRTTLCPRQQRPRESSYRNRGGSLHGRGSRRIQAALVNQASAAGSRPAERCGRLGDARAEPAVRRVAAVDLVPRLAHRESRDGNRWCNDPERVEPREMGREPHRNRRDAPGPDEDVRQHEERRHLHRHPTAEAPTGQHLVDDAAGAFAGRDQDVLEIREAPRRVPRQAVLLPDETGVVVVVERGPDDPRPGRLKRCDEQVETAGLEVAIAAGGRAVAFSFSGLLDGASYVLAGLANRSARSYCADWVCSRPKPGCSRERDHRAPRSRPQRRRPPRH